MKIKNTKMILLSLFICIFCFNYLYIKTPASAQYPVTSYYEYMYEYMSPNSSPSYLNNNLYSFNYLWPSMYTNNYSWSNNQYFDRDIKIPKLQKDEWIVQPAFGNTVYALGNQNEGGSLTIYGTYFSAHTQAGVNFNRTVSMGNSSYPTTNQSMHQNIFGQSSFSSPLSYYARLVLQFSPVLHGPLLNY